MRLTHVRLLVSDFGRSLRFYRDVIGLEPRFGDEEGVYEEFDVTPGILALFDRRRMIEALGSRPSFLAGREQVGDGSVLCLAVRDVDTEYRRLEEAGVEFLTEPHDEEEWRLRVAHFRDPDGNLVEISSESPA